jgi:hypothetical protein
LRCRSRYSIWYGGNAAIGLRDDRCPIVWVIQIYERNAVLQEVVGRVSGEIGGMVVEIQDRITIVVMAGVHHARHVVGEDAEHLLIAAELLLVLAAIERAEQRLAHDPQQIDLLVEPLIGARREGKADEAAQPALALERYARQRADVDLLQDFAQRGRFVTELFGPGDSHGLAGHHLGREPFHPGDLIVLEMVFERRNALGAPFVGVVDLAVIVVVLTEEAAVAVDEAADLGQPLLDALIQLVEAHLNKPGDNLSQEPLESQPQVKVGRGITHHLFVLVFQFLNAALELSYLVLQVVHRGSHYVRPGRGDA